jgi:hypothetical protein
MTPTSSRFGAILAGTALLLAGCDIALLRVTNPEAADLTATCGDVTFDSVEADPSGFPPVAEISDHVDLAALGMEAWMFREHEWFIAHERRSTVVLFGVARNTPEQGSAYAFASLHRDGDRWDPRSWGQCRITVSARGWGHAAFVLDPATAPDPAADRILISAWENNCASGQAPQGREVRPVVLDADDEAVWIVVLVEPVRGGATCPGNPAFPLEVPVDGPLGDRTVYDASTSPALARPWPPTGSSVSSQGRDE